MCTASFLVATPMTVPFYLVLLVFKSQARYEDDLLNNLEDLGGGLGQICQHHSKPITVGPTSRAIHRCLLVHMVLTVNVWVLPHVAPAASPCTADRGAWGVSELLAPLEPLWNSSTPHGPTCHKISPVHHVVVGQYKPSNNGG